MSLSEHQFGQLVHEMDTEGGFTYDPRKKALVTSGFSVAAHPAAELPIKHPEHVTEAHLQGYIKGSAPVWQQQKAAGKGQEMIGGWRDTDEGKDVLDLPKVFPATPVGQEKSRRAQILRNQESSFNLHEKRPDVNPWFTGSDITPPTELAQNFPEFSHLIRNNREAALSGAFPEITSWTEAPVRQEQFAKQMRRRK